jgi:hypothetical protein
MHSYIYRYPNHVFEPTPVSMVELILEKWRTPITERRLPPVSPIAADPQGYPTALATVVADDGAMQSRPPGLT